MNKNNSRNNNANNKKEKNVVTNFATFIFEERKKRNLTQKQLAEIIMVSNKTISKWENGQTEPTLGDIIIMCRELNISPSAVVKSKRTIKDVFYSIKKKIYSLFNYILKNIFVIGFIIIFIYLFIYYLNNWGQDRTYIFQTSNDDITFENGYLIKNKMYYILNISNIALNNVDYDVISLELYTLVNGDKYSIYIGESLNDINIVEKAQYASIFSKDVVSGIKNNLYLDIIAKDKKGKIETFKSVITIREVYKNNKLFYNGMIVENIAYDLKFQNKKYNQIINGYYGLNKLSFKYNDVTDTYYMFNKDGKIEYNKELGKLDYEIKEGIKVVMVSYKDNYVSINVYSGNNKEESIKYLMDTEKIICLTNNCNYNNYLKYVMDLIGFHNNVVTIL